MRPRPQSRSSRGSGRGAPGFALLALLLLVSTRASAQTLVRGPYLQQGTPSSMVVRWRTSSPVESVLSYGPSPSQLTTTITSPAAVTEHEIAIQSLAADTLYYYAVGGSAGLLAGADADHFFVTSPLPGTQRPIRIWVIGDSGECAVAQQGCIDAGAVRDRYLEFADGDIADVWLLLGDNAYTSGTDQQFTDGLFEVYPQVLRNTVAWPVPGNHEFGSSDSPTQSGPYYEAFTLPAQAEAGGIASGTEAYYSFDYGNVHFIALDSHDTSRSSNGAMYTWLETDLMATEADWLIAYWHHPPYTKGSHDSDSDIDSQGRMRDMRETFVPLLESHGLDLQLTGHSHSYERSMLIDGHYGKSSSFDPLFHALDTGDGDPEGDGAYTKATLGLAPHEGSVYSVVGSSSKDTGGLSLHAAMMTAINYEGALVVDVDGATLEATFIDKDGVLGDVFRVEKVPEAQSPAMQVAALAVLAALRSRRRTAHPLGCG